MEGRRIYPSAKGRTRAIGEATSRNRLFAHIAPLASVVGELASEGWFVCRVYEVTDPVSGRVRRVSVHRHRTASAKDGARWIGVDDLGLVWVWAPDEGAHCFVRFYGTTDQLWARVGLGRTLTPHNPARFGVDPETLRVPNHDQRKAGAVRKARKKRAAAAVREREAEASRVKTVKARGVTGEVKHVFRGMPESKRTHQPVTYDMGELVSRTRRGPDDVRADWSDRAEAERLAERRRKRANYKANKRRRLSGDRAQRVGA